jgi:type I restriction enzyme, R subunit
VLAHLMTRGQTVAGGDRLGKTIVFAKNHAHAVFIAERFDINYPHYKGAFARVIDCTVDYAQTLIDDFSLAAKAPHIAISVDMLDTGIDIPEVVNLVFFKLVRSKTKFWQMVGRGTRLCPEIFGPGKDKEFFYLFDYCQNLEFFSQDPATTDGALAASLGKRLFLARLDLIGTLDRQPHDQPGGGEGVEGDAALRRDAAGLLHAEVAAMNLNNFVVRPKRRLVEKYAKPEAWETLSPEDLTELGDDVAGLPAEIEAEDEEAKRFDLLLLNLQLAMLRSEPRFATLRDQVQSIAGLLEEKASIPMVQQQLAFILEIQTDEWWWHVTLPMLDDLRKRLRSLVKFIDKQKRKPIYTDFSDEMGDETDIPLEGFATPSSYERFRAKARHFLKAHEDHVAIHKLRMNKPLTESDLAELERMLVESGIGGSADVEQAKQESNGLGLFVRSLLGLDRAAAKEAFAGFLTGKTLKANQIEFVNMVIEHLVEHGAMKAALLYESPYTDLNPRGVDGLFVPAQVEELIGILDGIRARGAA